MIETQVPVRIANYKQRTWKTHVFDPGSPDAPPMKCVPEHERPMACDSTSDLAERIGDDPNRFYRDLELAAVGLDPTIGMTLGYRLAHDWQGHQKGTLIMVVFTSPTEFTFAIEVF